MVRPSSRESMGPTSSVSRSSDCDAQLVTILLQHVYQRLLQPRSSSSMKERGGHSRADEVTFSGPQRTSPPSSLLGPSTRSPGRRVVPESTSTISIARRPTPANPGELPASKQQPSLHVLPPTSHVPAQRRYPPVSSAEWPCTPCIPRLGPVDDSDPSPPATCIRIPPQMAPEYPRRGHACAQDGGQD